MSEPLRRNIELKARLRDPAAAHETARRLATASGGIERQVDTYFVVAHGRMKLREIDGGPARLVWYDRPNGLEPKGSDYYLLPVAEPRSLKDLLAAALGVAAVVDKRRTIYFYQNVRIHLDEVAELGAFLEFEAVLGEGVDEPQGQAQVAELRRAFQLDDDDLRAGSYGEMLGENPLQSS